MLTSGLFGYFLDYVLWWLIFASLILHTWCFFRFFPWAKCRRTGLCVGNGLIFLCLLGAVAIAGESYFRFACVETDAFGVSLPARRWFALNTKLNSMGCRDAEWTVEKPEGTRRIAFLGDSFTYGWGIKEIEDRFPDLIQSMFDTRQPGAYEVMNVSKPGWGSESQLDPIRDMIERFGVDEVVLCYVANDIDHLVSVTDDFDPGKPPEPYLFDPDRSCLLDYLYRTLYLPRVPAVRGYHARIAEAYDDPSTWLQQQQQLGKIISLCRSSDTHLRVALLPFVQTAGEAYSPAIVHARLTEFFEGNGIEVVDLLPSIADAEPSELIVNRRDAHPNERAHRLFADAIWQAFYVDSGT